MNDSLLFLSASQGTNAMLFALIALFVIAGLLIAGCVAATAHCMRPNSKHKGRRNSRQTRNIILIAGYAAAIIILVFAFICLGIYRSTISDPVSPTDSTTASQDVQHPTQDNTDPPTDPPTEPPTEPQPTLDMGQHESANPNSYGVKWDIIVNNSVTGSYNRKDPISFSDPTRASYFALPGIATFRGSNFRDGATYGMVNVVNNTLTNLWEKEISSMPKGVSEGYWTGCGWTGQPLMVQWDEETKQIMNLYPDKKRKRTLLRLFTQP